MASEDMIALYLHLPAFGGREVDALFGQINSLRVKWSRSADDTRLILA